MTEYEQKLHSPAWQRTRLWAFVNARFQCEKCGSKRGLQVHHLNYRKPIGEELPSDVQALCAGCHASCRGPVPHGKNRAPHGFNPGEQN